MESKLSDTFQFQRFPRFSKPVKNVKKKKIHNKVKTAKINGQATTRLNLRRVIKLLNPPRSRLIKKLDKLFSDYIKKKAKGKCFKCGKISKSAGVSHYFSRKYIGGRWEKANCDWSCWGCHYFQLERDKTPGSWYYQYMIKKLGKKDFEYLIMKVQAINKFSTKEIQLMVKNFNKIWK